MFDKVQFALVMLIVHLSSWLYTSLLDCTPLFLIVHHFFVLFFLPYSTFLMPPPLHVDCTPLLNKSSLLSSCWSQTTLLDHNWSLCWSYYSTLQCLCVLHFHGVQWFTMFTSPLWFLCACALKNISSITPVHSVLSALLCCALKNLVDHAANKLNPWGAEGIRCWNSKRTS